MKIVYHTKHYPGEIFGKYIEKAISSVPEKDLKGIVSLNVYDSCRSHFPVSAKGGHYPATKNMGAVIDLYLDENLGHMKSYHSESSFITRLSDIIYIKLFGKKFIIHTLLHEIGHSVDSTVNKRKNNKREESFADDYANEILNKIYPLNSIFYSAINNIYRTVYKQRIEHDNKAGNCSK